MVLALALAFLGAAITLEDRRWVLNHPWLLTAFWTSAGVVGLLWAVLFLRGRKPRLPTTQQKTAGNLSPNIIATDGSTVHFNTTPPQEAKPDQKRPYVRPLEFSHVDMGEQIYSGYREFLRVSNDGESAYDIRVEELEVGLWRVQFEPLSILKGQARIMVARISRVTYINGTPHIDTWQELDGAWKDALTTHPTLDKTELRIHYRDYRERPFLSTCSIERIINQRGMTVFPLADREDMSVVPTPGTGRYAT